MRWLQEATSVLGIWEDKNSFRPFLQSTQLSAYNSHKVIKVLKCIFMQKSDFRNLIFLTSKSERCYYFPCFSELNMHFMCGYC